MVIEGKTVMPPEADGGATYITLHVVLYSTFEQSSKN